jgi:hypothetical protein
MMGFYAKWIVPALIDLSMRNKRLRPYRERVAGAAEGRVLDIRVRPEFSDKYARVRAHASWGFTPAELFPAPSLSCAYPRTPASVRGPIERPP